MSKLSHSELNDRIALLERRLDRRRARLMEDTEEATEAAKHAAVYVLPVAAAVGAGVFAMWIMRRQRRPTQRWADRWFASRRPSEATVRRGVRWGSIAGIVGTAIRIGTSPQARALYHAVRRKQRAYP